MKKGRGFLERMAADADLPGEGIPGESLVEILGQSRVLVEGHRGVREYSREKISVSVKFGEVCICGCNLELIHMSGNQLVIRGQIYEITLLRRG